MIFFLLVMMGWSQPGATFTCKPNSWYVRCESLSAYPNRVTWEVWPPGGTYHKDYDEGLTAYLKAVAGDSIRMIVSSDNEDRIIIKTLDKNRIIE